MILLLVHWSIHPGEDAKTRGVEMLWYGYMRAVEDPSVASEVEELIRGLMIVLLTKQGVRANGLFEKVHQQTPCLLPTDTDADIY